MMAKLRLWLRQRLFGHQARAALRALPPARARRRRWSHALGKPTGRPICA
jgi:hypothetical protein